MNQALSLVLLLAFPAAALAGGPKNDFSDELGVAAGQSDPRNPRTGQVTDNLAASVDVGKGVSLELSAGITLLEATKGVARQQFGSEGGSSLYFSPGATWQATDHFTFGTALAFSPRSRLRTDTSLSYTPAAGRTAAADAQVSASTRSWGARASASYETGESDWETALDLDAAVTHFDADQRIIAARDPETGKALDLAQLKTDVQAFCKSAACTSQLLGLLKDKATPLTQTTVGVTLTETIHADTDVALGGAYRFYDRDPTEVGFFGLVAAPRSVGFGSAMPLAPLSWTVRPEMSHRFGNLGVRLSLEHGAYVDDEGTTNVLGAKLQYRFTKSYRMWIKASLQRDTDGAGKVTLFNQASLGAMWLF